MLEEKIIIKDHYHKFPKIDGWGLNMILIKEDVVFVSFYVKILNLKAIVNIVVDYIGVKIENKDFVILTLDDYNIHVKELLQLSDNIREFIDGYKIEKIV